jgi:putative tricarboxylic transport membrane protein
VLAGLALCGVAACAAIVRDRRAAGEPRLAWPPLALIAAGAALHVLLAATAGFIVAAALLFWLTARAFDARRPLRDAACAVGVAVASYALFEYALRLPLPSGVFGAWL